MIRFIVFPALICLSLPYWPTLMPSNAVFFCLFTASIFLLNKYTRLAGCVLLAVVWVNYIATDYAQHLEQIVKNPAYTTIKGEIDSLIFEKKTAQSLLFLTDPISLSSDAKKQKYRLRLYWKNSPKILSQGQRWELKVKLSPIVSKLNGVGYDPERYYLAQHIHAGATVKDARLLKNKITIRQKFYSYIDQKLLNENAKHRDFILALSFGVRYFLSTETREELKDAGLLHLLAISGLHIGLVLYFAWWLGAKFSVCLDTGDRYHAYIWIFSLFCGFAYTWLAGFSLSAQRALVMGAVILWYREKGIPLTSYQPWLFSFSFCLLFDPLAVFSVSFYLSYVVVIILLFMGHFLVLQGKKDQRKYSTFSALKKYFLSLIFIQIFLFIFMFPLQCFIFSGIAYLSPFFNFFMVPWVSLICVPLVIFSLLLPFPPVIWLTDLSFIPLTNILPYASGHWLSWYQIQMFFIDYSLKKELVFGVILSFLCLLVYLFICRRHIVIFFSGCLFCYLLFHPVLSQKDHWKMSVLDVGHGLSVIIEKNQRAVLYDVGKSWDKGSIAQSVVYPYLQKALIRQLDGLILSHDDNDHTGDWPYLAKKMPPKWKIASSLKPDFFACIRGKRWRWNGLFFEVLWPPELADRAYNKDSCVVLVSDKYHRILLTGDLENIEEYRLLNYEDDLHADIALVPHHGSKDASNIKWTKAVQAKYVFNSSAKISRWNLPHPDVLNNYSQTGSWFLDTAEQGRIEVSFNGKKMELKTARDNDAPFWYRHLLNKEKSSRIKRLFPKK